MVERTDMTRLAFDQSCCMPAAIAHPLLALELGTRASCAGCTGFHQHLAVGPPDGGHRGLPALLDVQLAASEWSQEEPDLCSFLAGTSPPSFPWNGALSAGSPVVVPITDSTPASRWFLSTYRITGTHTAHWETISCTEVMALVQRMKRQSWLGAKIAHLLHLGPDARGDAWLHWEQRNICRIEVGSYHGAEAFVLWRGWTEA